MNLIRRTTANGDEPAPGTGVPTHDVDVVEAPADPQERQAFLQSVVAEVTEQHSGQGLDEVVTALTTRLREAGVPEQPQKWLTDTASEIAEGRHVVVDRHLAVGGEGADEVPDEAVDPDA